MAKIVEYRDIPLSDLSIGKSQARTVDPGRDVDELARSIEVQGLLQPIVVCPLAESEKWEILTGQRRFLAHQRLRRETISAAVLDERVGEAEAKTISVTENLVRRQLTGKELTDSITYLYGVYGSVRDVAVTTGISATTIRKHVKARRLVPELREMYDEGKIDINVALDAQDAATEADKDEPDAELAVKLAGEMAPMTGVQRKKFGEDRRAQPEKPIDQAIEDAKSGARIIQIVATVTQETHRGVAEYAKREGRNRDEAAAALIEQALVEHGLLEE